jgi:hypothetical protein
MFEQFKEEWDELDFSDKCGFILEIAPSLVSISVALMLVGYLAI